jgi:hypothetical protein
MVMKALCTGVLGSARGLVNPVLFHGRALLSHLHKQPFAHGGWHRPARPPPRGLRLRERHHGVGWWPARRGEHAAACCGRRREMGEVREAPGRAILEPFHLPPGRTSARSAPARSAPARSARARAAALRRAGKSRRAGAGAPAGRGRGPGRAGRGARRAGQRTASRPKRCSEGTRAGGSRMLSQSAAAAISRNARPCPMSNSRCSAANPSRVARARQRRPSARGTTCGAGRSALHPRARGGGGGPSAPARAARRPHGKSRVRTVSLRPWQTSIGTPPRSPTGSPFQYDGCARRPRASARRPRARGARRAARGVGGSAPIGPLPTADEGP